MFASLLDLDWTVRHGRSSAMFVILHESPEVLYTDVYSSKESWQSINNLTKVKSLVPRLYRRSYSIWNIASAAVKGTDQLD
jgi:hypothetical protein